MPGQWGKAATQSKAHFQRGAPGKGSKAESTWRKRGASLPPKEHPLPVPKPLPRFTPVLVH